MRSINWEFSTSIATPADSAVWILKNGRRITFRASRGPASSSITSKVGLFFTGSAITGTVTGCPLPLTTYGLKQFLFHFSELAPLSQRNVARARPRPICSFQEGPFRKSETKSNTQLCKKDAVVGVIVLFLHYGRRLDTDFVIGSADPQGVHAVLQHSAADSQQIGGMGLDIVCSFKGIQDNFTFEFHHGLFERQSAREGVVAE